MSTTGTMDLARFVGALAIEQPEALTQATKEAYAIGADVRELLSAVEVARLQAEIPSLVIDHARTTVFAWQWIADRRRALA